jgi:hypothetical protein
VLGVDAVTAGITVKGVSKETEYSPGPFLVMFLTFTQECGVGVCTYGGNMVQKAYLNGRVKGKFGANLADVMDPSTI